MLSSGLLTRAAKSVIIVIMSANKNSAPHAEADQPARRRRGSTTALAAMALTAAASIALAPSQGEAEKPSDKVVTILERGERNQLDDMATNGARLTVGEMIRTAKYYGKSPYGLTTNTPDGQSMSLEDPDGMGMGAPSAWYKVGARSNALTVAYGTGAPEDPNFSSVSMTFTNSDHQVPKNLSPYYAQAFLIRNATRLSSMETTTGDLAYKVSISSSNVAEVQRISGDDVSGPYAPMDGRLNYDRLQADPTRIPDFIKEQITGQPSSY